MLSTLLEDSELSIDPILAALMDPSHQCIAPGVYIADLNWDHVLEFSERLANEYPFTPSYDLPHDQWMAAIDDATLPHDYGVCDEWQQITTRWPRIISDPRQLIIALTPIVRSEEPAHGGWRWHKWGEYIGTHHPQHEYLYDEVGIDQVYVFHIYEVK